MAWLGDLFATGRIIDAILLLVAAEACLVAVRPGLFGPRPPLLAGLAAGAGLMLALRATLAGASWPWIAAALAAAFAAHLGELALRRVRTICRREPAATSVHAPALAADVQGPTDRIGVPPFPFPSAGESGARRGSGEGGNGAERSFAFKAAPSSPEAGIPSPDPC